MVRFPEHRSFIGKSSFSLDFCYFQVFICGFIKMKLSGGRKIFVLLQHRFKSRRRCLLCRLVLPIEHAVGPPVRAQMSTTLKREVTANDGAHKTSVIVICIFCLLAVLSGSECTEQFLINPISKVPHNIALSPSSIAVTFLFAFIGGLMVDLVGPKFTASMGFTCQLTGWILLQANRNFAFTLLLSAGSEPIMFSLISTLEGDKPFTIIATSLIVGSRSISLALPLLFTTLLSAGCSSSVLTVSMILCLATCLMASLVVLPTSTPLSSISPRSNNDNAVTLFLERQQLEEQQETAVVADCPVFGYKVREGFRDSRALKNTNSLSIASTRAAVEDDISDLSFSINSGCFERLSSQIKDIVFNCIPESKFELAEIYLPLIPLAIIALICSTYYVNSLPSQFNADALNMSNRVMPLYFFASLFMGFVAKRYSIFTSMYVTAMFSTLTFICLLLVPLFPNFMSYSAIFFGWMVQSFCFTQLYCYSKICFSSRHLGVLLGTALCVSGFISLLVFPVCDLSAYEAPAMNSLCLFLSALSAVFVYALQSAFTKQFDHEALSQQSNSGNLSHFSLFV